MGLDRNNCFRTPTMDHPHPFFKKSNIIHYIIIKYAIFNNIIVGWTCSIPSSRWSWCCTSTRWGRWWALSQRRWDRRDSPQSILYSSGVPVKEWIQLTRMILNIIRYNWELEWDIRIRKGLGSSTTHLIWTCIILDCGSSTQQACTLIGKERSWVLGQGRYTNSVKILR